MSKSKRSSQFTVVDGEKPTAMTADAPSTKKDASKKPTIRFHRPYSPKYYMDKYKSEKAERISRGEKVTPARAKIFSVLIYIFGLFGMFFASMAITLLFANFGMVAAQQMVDNGSIGTTDAMMCFAGISGGGAAGAVYLWPKEFYAIRKLAKSAAETFSK